jgi:hypothetical protein
MIREDMTRSHHITEDGYENIRQEKRRDDIKTEDTISNDDEMR